MSRCYQYDSLCLLGNGNDMSGPMILLVVVLIGVGFGLIFYLFWLYEKKRSKKLRDIANELGIKFSVRGEWSLLSRLTHFQLFSKGDGRKIYNMLHGTTNDVEMAIFDYQYTTGSGKHRQTHTQSVISFQSPLLNLPYFTMRPEGFFDKIAGLVGYQDIDFDTHPQFSKMYVLRGRNEPEIRDFFNDDLLTTLESLARVNVDAGGDQLVVYRPSKRITPQGVRAFMEEGFQIYALFRDAQPEET